MDAPTADSLMRLAEESSGKLCGPGSKAALDRLDDRESAIPSTPAT